MGAPAELPGVDTSAIKQADPGFDDDTFRAIARETFYKVREARKLQNPQESAELLSPQMQREIQDEIGRDTAAITNGPRKGECGAFGPAYPRAVTGRAPRTISSFARS